MESNESSAAVVEEEEGGGAAPAEAPPPPKDEDDREANGGGARIGDLPPELVEMIVLRLDGRSFARCRRVCRAWREIVDRLAPEMNLWKGYSISEYPDAWSDVYNKGQLQWSDAYVNLSLWPKIDSAQAVSVLAKHFDRNKRIMTLTITKGGSINVILRNCIMRYDSQTFKKIEKIRGQYFYYYQDDFVKLIHAETHTLFLRPSIMLLPDADRDFITIDSVYLFKTLDDVCYYVTLKQELWMYDLKADGYDGRRKLVQWYELDAIMGLDGYQSKIYMLTQSGKIITYEQNKFVEVRTVKWPDNFNLYQKLYLFRGNIFCYCDYSNFLISIPNGKEVTYTDLFASSALLHGNILVIGTYFGLLSLYLINDIEDLLALDRLSPLATHLLCVDNPLIGIDVMEERGRHRVFTWTQNNIYMVKFSHFEVGSAEDCATAEKVLCESLDGWSLEKCDANSNDEDEDN